MKKKVIICGLILFVIVIATFCLVKFSTTFKPGKFGDLELREDGTYTLNGCGNEEGTYEVSDDEIILYIGDEEYKMEAFTIKIINVDKLQIVVNGTNCPQYTDAIYERD